MRYYMGNEKLYGKDIPNLLLLGISNKTIKLVNSRKARLYLRTVLFSRHNFGCHPVGGADHGRPLALVGGDLCAEPEIG